MGRDPGVGRVFYKSRGSEEWVTGSGQKIQGEDAIAARETVGVVEAEADGVWTGDESVVEKGEGEGEGGESSTDAAEGLCGLGDGDGVVVEREPWGGIYLDAGLLGVAKIVDLEGKGRGGIALGGRKRESDRYGGAVIAEDFDGEWDARRGFLRGRKGKKEREEEQPDEKSVPHFAC